MVTLLLGNGFDLDLGLKTSYSQFFNSKFPSENLHYPSLLRTYLVDMAFSQNWYDIEGVCKEYATKAVKEVTDSALATIENSIKSLDSRNRSYDEIADDDKCFFESLCRSLKQYIQERLDSDKINYKSYAACVLKLVAKFADDIKLLTFNYTNIGKLQDLLYVEKIIPDDDITYVHGNCNEDIILGTDEDLRLTPNYSFLFKSWHQNYQSLPVIDYLYNSSNIIFFGLSFGNIDLVYFEQFFRRICNGEFDNQKKTITIFTFDESSRQSILLNLLKMGIKTMDLKNHCNLNFILTSPKIHKSQEDNTNYQNFISYIRQLS